MEKNESPVYSRTVIEFVAVANEFCKYAEQARKIKGDELLRILQRILPLLYLKTTLLPDLEPFFEEGNEKYVTEDDWTRVKESFQLQFGSADDYYELTEGISGNIGEPAAVTLSENLADIYQDLKDFLLLYRTGTDEVMNDAVWECRLNFENIWGKKAVSALVAIHRFVYSGNETGLNTGDRSIADEGNIEDWIISKRLKELRDDE